MENGAFTAKKKEVWSYLSVNFNYCFFLISNMAGFNRDLTFIPAVVIYFELTIYYWNLKIKSREISQLKVHSLSLIIPLLLRCTAFPLYICCTWVHCEVQIHILFLFQYEGISEYKVTWLVISKSGQEFILDLLLAKLRTVRISELIIT